MPHSYALLTKDDCPNCTKLKNEFPCITEEERTEIQELPVGSVDGRVEAEYYDIRSCPALIVYRDDIPDCVIVGYDEIKEALTVAIAPQR